MIHEPVPGEPGWHTWATPLTTGFNSVVLGDLRVRTEGERSVRLRMHPGSHHSNLGGALHGGVAMALIDVSLFAAPSILIDTRLVGGVTVDLSCQFIGSGSLTDPVDAVTEVLRETGRLVFQRGLLMQGEHLVASYTGTIRKPSLPQSGQTR